MAFLRGVKTSSTLDHLRNEGIRELQVFDLKYCNGTIWDRLKYYKLAIEGIHRQNVELETAKQVWKYTPIGHVCGHVGRKRWLGVL